MNKKSLVFKDGQFRLTEGFHESVQNLKGAVALSQYADGTAKRVLQRRLNQNYRDPQLPRLPFLDPTQLDGVRFVLSRKRSYLAHAPGAGKTVIAIVSFLLSGCDRALIVVPPHLTVQWQREIDRFAPQVSFTDDSVTVIGSGRVVDETARFIILADTFLDRPEVQDLLDRVKPEFVAVDEASRLKEHTSIRTVAFYGGSVQKSGKRFKGLYSDAKHVVLLDGSPMPNGRAMELWAPLYAMDPEAIDCLDRHQFGVQFCNAQQDRFGHWAYQGMAKPNEFNERITKRFMHVVTEDQLSHPERRRSLLFMDRDPRLAKHKTWERSHLDKLDLSSISESASQGDLATWRRETGLQKVDWIASYVSDRFRERNESMLVFCWHREVADGLHRALMKRIPKAHTGLVIGGTSLRNREVVFQQFQKGLIKIIVGNIKAMGRGPNLQRADRVVFAEYSWTDEDNKQAEKRASRRGSKRKFVRCEYIVIPASMDEKVLSSVFYKERRVKAVIR